MTIATIVIDTGPLVALVHDRDHYHVWARQQVSHLNAPFLTCDAVLSETWFLLRTLPKAQNKLLALLKTRAVISGFDSAVETEPVLELLQKYSNVPMSFADACLVRMSELHRNAVIFTADSDFTIYRRNRNEIIELISPPQN